MSLNNSSFEGLRSFVTELNKNSAKEAVDPYNTFNCKFTLVEPYNSEEFSTYNSDILYKDELYKYIEELKLPDVITDGGSTPLLHGKYNLTTTLPITVDNKFTVSFINLMPKPIIENVMYPWMQRVAGVNSSNSKDGTGSDLDYPRADFTVTFPHLRLFNNTTDGVKYSQYPQYTYHNARPINIQTYKPSNKPATSLYREVQFAFDYFSISHENSDNLKMLRNAVDSPIQTYSPANTINETAYA